MTETTAHQLLEEYFADRARTFPSAGGYVTVFPSPEQFTPPAGVFLVVEVDGEDVGCGGIRRLADTDAGPRFEVKHLWLRPHVRGRHLGRALLAELERRARVWGAAEVVLDTNASLEAAAGLYLSSGYESVEPYNDNPNATHWYAKRL